jgi:hypothetical protein
MCCKCKTSCAFGRRQVIVFLQTSTLKIIDDFFYLLAAHCITDEDGNLFPKEFYVVAVGKRFRKYSDSRDSAHTQTSQVS